MFDNLKKIKHGAIVVSTLVVFMAGCGDGKSKVNERIAPVYNTPVNHTSTNIEQSSIKTSTQDAAGLGTFSTGYRVGQISKFSVKGIAFKSGEGQMLMGRESTPYIITSNCGDGDTCRKTINPWYFSMSERDAPLMKSYAGEYAWVKYSQSNIKSPKFGTDYIINEIGKIDRDTQLKTCIDISASGAKSEGVRVGRIVKASMKGTFSKTGEIMIQVGNAGNQFKNMSVTEDMYNCAVTALKTARKVKVHYAQGWFRNPLSSDTTYAVTKIEVIKDI